MDAVRPQHPLGELSIIRSLQLRRPLLPWFYLLLITAAEILIALALALPGLLLHAVLVVLLTFHTAFGRGVAKRRLSFALTIVPLLRLLTLSLPLTALPQIAWYPEVSALLLIAAFIVSRQLALTRADLCLSPGHVPAQLLLIGLGPGLGASEYLILRPAPVVTFASWQDIWLPAFVLMIFAGLSEEIIFGGLLQSVARPVLGYWTLVYGALLFAAMHAGYRSVVDVVFVFGVGLLFGKIAEIEHGWRQPEPEDMRLLMQHLVTRCSQPRRAARDIEKDDCNDLDHNHDNDGVALHDNDQRHDLDSDRDAASLTDTEGDRERNC